MCCNIHHFGIAKRKVMGSKLQVTLTKLQVTPTKLQVTLTKLQVTSTKLQVTLAKLQVTPTKLQVTLTKLQVTYTKCVACKWLYFPYFTTLRQRILQFLLRLPVWRSFKFAPFLVFFPCRKSGYRSWVIPLCSIWIAV